MADEGGVKRNPGSWSLSSKSTTTSPRPRGTRAHSSRARTRIAHSISTTWLMFPSSSPGCREIQLASSQSASMASPQAHFRKKQEKGEIVQRGLVSMQPGAGSLGSPQCFSISSLRSWFFQPCSSQIQAPARPLWGLWGLGTELFGQRSKYQPSNELRPNQFSRGISRLISLALFADAAAILAILCKKQTRDSKTRKYLLHEATTLLGYVLRRLARPVVY
jgi:hypothetical protein